MCELLKGMSKKIDELNPQKMNICRNIKLHIIIRRKRPLDIHSIGLVHRRKQQWNGTIQLLRSAHSPTPSDVQWAPIMDKKEGKGGDGGGHWGGELRGVRKRHEVRLSYRYIYLVRPVLGNGSRVMWWTMMGHVSFTYWPYFPLGHDITYATTEMLSPEEFLLQVSQIANRPLGCSTKGNWFIRVGSEWIPECVGMCIGLWVWESGEHGGVGK